MAILLDKTEIKEASDKTIANSDPKDVTVNFNTTNRYIANDDSVNINTNVRETLADTYVTAKPSIKRIKIIENKQLVPPF